MKETNNHIELRDNEVKAILGKTPNSLIRYGIVSIFLGFTALLIGSMFFSYPETVKCRVTILSSNPPIHLIAQRTGRISHLLVQDKEIVTKNQTLVIIENPANTPDMMMMSGLIDSLRTNKRSLVQFKKVIEKQEFKLGDLTPYYIEFTKAIKEYFEFDSLCYHQKKIEALKGQITLMKKQKEQMLRQLSLSKKELHIEELNHSRDSSLFEIKAIASIEYEQSKKDLIIKERLLIGEKIAIEDIDLRLKQLDVSLLELKTEYSQQSQHFISTVSRTLDALNNQIEVWEKNYTFRAPHAGVVSFAKLWAPNQTVLSGEPIISILPDREEKIIGKMEIPVSGFGKVKKEQKVSVKIDSYPYMQFGHVVGKITSVSLVPINEQYNSEIEFPRGLISSYNIDIPFSQEMTGIAEVNTNNLSLFQRFTQPIRYYLDRFEK